MSNTIYVHIDTTSNAVSTRELNVRFQQGIVHQQKSIVVIL